MEVFKIFCLLFAIFLFNKVHSLTDAEAKAKLISTLMECNIEFPVEMSELAALQALKTPKNKQTKCLLACTYKKLKIFTAKGMHDLEQNYKLAELTKEGDEKRLQNGRKLADICNKVNDIKVSDGDKGCERAAHLFKCVNENAPKLGFQI